jgi:translocation and assembly module TamA
MIRHCFKFFLFLAMPLLLWGNEGVSYSVEFEGLDDTKALKAIKSVAQLTSLKKAPPSLTALRQRAEADVPDILKILRAYGYYEAKVDFRIEENFPKARVLVYISTGPLYRIHSFVLNITSPEDLSSGLYEKLELSSIGIHLGEPAQSKTIINASNRVIAILSENGFPFAKITNREIIADGRSHQLDIELKINTGSIAFFGTTEITGASETDVDWIRRKFTWQEGDLYDSRKLQATQKNLIETGLFSSVMAIPEGMPDDHGCLPMNMDLAETLHRSVSGGFSYQTKFGMGVTFGWEHRNAGGEGQIVSIQGDITKISHSGILSFRIPDFKRAGQEFSMRLQALHEDIEHVYHEVAYSLTGRLERKIGRHLRFSIGGRAEQMYVTHSLQNGNSFLTQMPLYVGWADVNNILNPTSGITVDYFMYPSLNFAKVGRFYIEQRLSQGCYLPVVKRKEILTLAQKITIATIYSNELDDIPIPERILGGTEEDLRGYGYLTVSPLRRTPEGKLKPIGGRSAIFYTFETRFRVNDSIGLVPFFDLGNVWLEILPTFKHKWLKSVGLGVRYFTFIGPLRFDIGFPLDRRKGLDSAWRVLVSIGQSF